MAEYLENPTPKEQLSRARVLKNQVVGDDYEVDDSFIPANNVLETHTVEELLKFAESGECEVDARVICASKSGKAFIKKLTTSEFVEASKKPGSVQFKEGALDNFAYDIDMSTNSAVGEDYTPLLGGPFYKQLYIYDYLRQHSAAFFAFNHDPMARQVVQIIRDFTLGRGWSADCKNPIALAVWKAFEEANDLYTLIDSLAVEMSVYGETMIWWLPDNQTKIGYRVQPGQEPPKGLIPRIRLIDPSCIWEVVTYPEDITRVLYYQWVSPTQYQIYSGKDKGKSVGTSKFIYQQIPAEEVMHFKVNSVSNEKRGRSDLFPILGYLKRLRDSVNYSIISMQKNAAWSIDTTVEGSQTDIDAYVSSQQALGTIPMAGSEFVHSKKVERKYLANVGGGKGGASTSFEWCLSMIAAGSGIPVSYFGSHLSGGQTRASALVATEPVTKKFEKRRLVYEHILKKLSQKVLKHFGITDANIEFTFPELVSQDRSAKIKDTISAEIQGYITKQTAGAIVAKELDITNYNPEKEIDEAKEEMPAQGLASPLSTPGKLPEPKPQPSAITSDERRKQDMNNA